MYTDLPLLYVRYTTLIVTLRGQFNQIVCGQDLVDTWTSHREVWKSHFRFSLHFCCYSNIHFQEGSPQNFGAWLWECVSVRRALPTWVRRSGEQSAEIKVLYRTHLPLFWLTMTNHLTVCTKALSYWNKFPVSSKGKLLYMLQYTKAF